jgi:hypothetical protein
MRNMTGRSACSTPSSAFESLLGSAGSKQTIGNICCDHWRLSRLLRLLRDVAVNVPERICDFL